MKRQKLDIDSEIMSMLQRPPAAGFASPDAQNTQVPNLIKYLRRLSPPVPPAPVNQEAAASLPPPPSTAPPASQSSAFPDVSGGFEPKRASRGLVYPGAKPTPSKLYPFLRIK
jgi:hypothetical protein